MKNKHKHNTVVLFILGEHEVYNNIHAWDQFESVQTISLENKTNNKIRIEHLEYTVSQNIRL